MRLERLTAPEHGMYQGAMELYRSSFPFHEQREGDSQARIMGQEEYQFHLIYDGDVFAGLMLCWETARFIYVAGPEKQKIWAESPGAAAGAGQARHFGD